MNLETIKNAVTSKTARQVLIGRKYSPQILFVAGAVGAVTATVLACRATLKIETVLDVAKVQLDAVEEDFETTEITAEEAKRKRIGIQIATGIQIAKPYIPAAIILAGSLAALTGSHVILAKRNGALMAAYAGLDKAYRAYRKNVADKYGEAEDERFLANVRTVQHEEKTADGKIKKVDVNKGDATSAGSGYATLFAEHSRFFSKEPGRNSEILMIKQQYANDLLRLQGHLFLNEALDMLGLDRTPQGAIVGWVYDPRNEDHVGDNYVSLGIYANNPEIAREFINGDENAVWLDFNVDGPIWDKI